MFKAKLFLLLSLLFLLTACGGSPTAADTPYFEATTAAEVPLAPTPSGKKLQPLLAEANIPLDEVITLLPPNAIRAIRPAEAKELMIGAVEANKQGMSADVRIIGVEINGESRAYPIPFLSDHEIVNDTVGGQDIAVTW